MSRTRRAPHGGYTLIELLVSLGVFAFVVLIAAAAYLSFIAYNREAQTSATIINSLSFSIDRMARDIRTGEQYACPGGTCSSAGDASLTFTDTAGCTVTYSLGSAAIKRTVTGGSACDTEPTGAITDPSVSVSSLLFYVRGLSAGDNTQPIATMVVKGTACVPNTDCTGNGLISFDIQTSATERFPDIANAAGGSGDTGGGGDGGGGGGSGSTTPQTIQIFLPPGSSWTVPSDWNSANNTIEVIGAGGRSKGSNSGGGGGGAYSKITNLALTPTASVSYQIGSGSVDADGASSLRDTWFKSTSDVLAKGGSANTAGAGGAGGAASAGVGSVKYSGGAGGAYQGAGEQVGGGGGGAAGPSGNGADANYGAPNHFTDGPILGGTADAGLGGLGAGQTGNATSIGGSGTEWDASHGTGGGGADPGSTTGYGTGGTYGGGAGGRGYGSGSAQSNGSNGLIVITYTTAP